MGLLELGVIEYDIVRKLTAHRYQHNMNKSHNMMLNRKRNIQMDIQKRHLESDKVGKKFATYIINKGHIPVKLFWNQFQSVFFPTQTSKSTTPVQWIPQVKGLVLQNLSPSSLHMPLISPGYYLCFWMIGYKSEVPMTSSLGSINFLEQLTNSEKYFTY